MYVSMMGKSNICFVEYSKWKNMFLGIELGEMISKLSWEENLLSFLVIRLRRINGTS